MKLNDFIKILGGTDCGGAEAIHIYKTTEVDELYAPTTLELIEYTTKNYPNAEVDFFRVDIKSKDSLMYPRIHIFLK